MNFIQNNTDPSSYINKAKKQAKRLLQLSQKTNNTLAIKSLSNAQETLAKINGFPDWHAFIKYIEKEPITTQLTSSDVVCVDYQEENNLYKYKVLDNIYYRENERFFTSDFYLNFTGDFKELEKVITSLSEELEFYLNLNSHYIDVNFCQNKILVESPNNYELIKVSKELNLSNSEINKLFVVKNSSHSSFVVKNCIIISLNTHKTFTSTQDNMLKRHIELCKKIMKKIELKAISNYPLDFTHKRFKNLIKLPEISENFLMNNLEQRLNKMIFMLNVLKEEKIPCVISWNHKTEDITCFYDDFIELNELQQAFLKTNKFNNLNISFEEFKNETSSSTGLAFKDLQSGKIKRFSVNNRPSSAINIAIKSPIEENNRRLMELFLLDRHLSNRKVPVKSVLLNDDNEESSPYLNLLKNTINHKEIFLSTSGEKLKNIFSLPVGFNRFSDENLEDITNIFKLIMEYNSQDFSMLPQKNKNDFHYLLRKAVGEVNSLLDSKYNLDIYEGLNNKEKEEVKNIVSGEELSSIDIIRLVAMKNFDLALKIQNIRKVTVNDLVNYLFNVRKKKFSDIDNNLFDLLVSSLNNIAYLFAEDNYNTLLSKYELLIFNIESHNMFSKELLMAYSVYFAKMHFTLKENEYNEKNNTEQKMEFYKTKDLSKRKDILKNFLNKYGANNENVIFAIHNIRNYNHFLPLVVKIARVSRKYSSELIYTENLNAFAFLNNTISNYIDTLNSFTANIFINGTSRYRDSEINNYNDNKFKNEYLKKLDEPNNYLVMYFTELGKVIDYWSLNLL